MAVRRPRPAEREAFAHSATVEGPSAVERLQPVLERMVAARAERQHAREAAGRGTPAEQLAKVDRFFATVAERQRERKAAPSHQLTDRERRAAETARALQRDLAAAMQIVADPHGSERDERERLEAVEFVERLNCASLGVEAHTVQLLTLMACIATEAAKWSPAASDLRRAHGLPVEVEPEALGRLAIERYAKEYPERRADLDAHARQLGDVVGLWERQQGNRGERGLDKYEALAEALQGCGFGNPKAETLRKMWLRHLRHLGGK